MRPSSALSILSACLVLALCRPAAAQPAPEPARPTAAWLRGSGVALIVSGSVASLAGGIAGAVALTLGPQPQAPAVAGSILGWSLAIHALTVGVTVYGGVLLARGNAARAAERGRVAWVLAPYAEPRGAGLAFAARF